MKRNVFLNVKISRLGNSGDICIESTFDLIWQLQTAERGPAIRRVASLFSYSCHMYNIFNLTNQHVAFMIVFFSDWWNYRTLRLFWRPGLPSFVSPICTTPIRFEISWFVCTCLSQTTKLIAKSQFVIFNTFLITWRKTSA